MRDRLAGGGHGAPERQRAAPAPSRTRRACRRRAATRRAASTGPTRSAATGCASWAVRCRSRSPASPGSSSPSCARAADWQWSHARELARIAHHPPHLAAWHCIQHHETNARSAWRTNTGNGYFGGLQFDIGFQLTYGRWLYRAKGTAEHWTPLEQMWTAERAHASGRGFAPWPNTARMCGLL